MIFINKTETAVPCIPLLAWSNYLSLGCCVGQWGVIQAAAYDVTLVNTGKMRLLDALIRRILPVSLGAVDADAPDAF